MEPSSEDLERMADAILLETMPQGLKDVIDALLRAGEKPEAILERVKQRIARVRQHAGQGELTLMQCELYLQRKRHDA
jgi:hypothetical protein